jgi:hypothetical protein
MWREERLPNYSRNNPIINLCCSNGQVVLDPLLAIPSPISDLLDPRHANHVLFMRNIHTLNSLFAFTSLGAKVQPSPGPGSPVYIISGQLSHRIGALNPEGQNAERQYSQIYIYMTLNSKSPTGGYAFPAAQGATPWNRDGHITTDLFRDWPHDDRGEPVRSAIL